MSPNPLAVYSVQTKGNFPTACQNVFWLVAHSETSIIIGYLLFCHLSSQKSFCWARKSRFFCICDNKLFVMIVQTFLLNVKYGSLKYLLVTAMESFFTYWLYIYFYISLLVEKLFSESDDIFANLKTIWFLLSITFCGYINILSYIQSKEAQIFQQFAKMQTLKNLHCIRLWMEQEPKIFMRSALQLLCKIIKK